MKTSNAFRDGVRTRVITFIQGTEDIQSSEDDDDIKEGSEERLEVDAEHCESPRANARGEKRSKQVAYGMTEMLKYRSRNENVLAPRRVAHP